MSSTIPTYTAEFQRTSNCIHTGLAWRVVVNWTDASGATRDLTGYTATGNVTARDTLGAATLVAATLALSAADPNIVGTLTAAQTAALVPTDDSWFYLTLIDGAGHPCGILYGECPIVWWCV